MLAMLAGASEGKATATGSLANLISMRGGSVGASLTTAELSALQNLIGSAQGQTAIASLLDLRDIAGLLVVASPIETTVDAWSAQAWVVAPSNELAWTVIPGETAAYVEALTEYVGEFVE
jgi:hypothetical protein